MKKTIFIFSLLFAFTLVGAQQANNGILLSGSVIYEQIIQLDIQLEGDAAGFAASLPKEQISEKILHFTEEEALFMKNTNAEPDVDPLEEHEGMIIKMYEPDNLTYTDLTTQKVIEQKEFMSRIFLIESEPGNEKWKMTGKQKILLDYSCMEAISGEGEQTVRAWFTPQIPVSVGPATHGNLPGLILTLEIDEGNIVYRAIEVELKPVDKSVLKKPSKGKKVSQEEYQAIVEEKMKEMGMEHGGEGGFHSTVVIKIHQ